MLQATRFPLSLTVLIAGNLPAQLSRQVPLRTADASKLRLSTVRPAGRSMAVNEANEKYLEVALKAARQAGDLISAAFSEPKSVEFKGKFDLVTETDKQCEELILKALRQAFPAHKFIGEEGSAAQGFTAELTDEPTWLVGMYAFRMALVLCDCKHSACTEVTRLHCSCRSR